MGKFEEYWNGEHRGFWRFVILATVAFIVWVGLLRHDNLLRWGKAGMEYRRQNRQIEALQKDIDRMDKAIKDLSCDRDSLEGFAREEFHFAAPGDDVYIDENAR